ncbi:MAG: hypothetical protein HY852_19975 [Bradyrhizobium sp.]|uniref:hypothetical protein n=1 Tax=Bradyrhizobium sp. TaxID=376 RepID=UPI0025C55B36|nr:hypothetical protein [Bradyrhizobium sp.]MBI5264085.1 hypothetical protein [Bradyrhizobium sp.]
MRRLILAGATLMVLEAAAFSADNYWVVGNRATNTCDIVTSNPVIFGDIWFGDGPYTSKDDAKLARSTIGACPKDDTKDEPAADGNSADK